MTKEFKHHDNIDYDVINVSKDSLRLRLESCARFAALPSEILGYGGVAITLLSAAFLTSTFHGLWTIPGETIRATFLFGGIAATIATVRKLVQWYYARTEHTPAAIVKSLATESRIEPVALLAAPSVPIVAQPRQRRARRYESSASGA